MIALAIFSGLAMTPDEAPTGRAAAYPLSVVYSEFSQACGQLERLEAAEEKLVDNGWVRSLPVAASPMGKLVRFQEEQARQVYKAEGGSPSKPLIFRKMAHGRSLDLMLQGVAVEGGFINGCRMWDFNVDQPPAVRSLLNLRTGKATVVQEDGLIRLDWPKSDGLGLQSLQIVHIASDHSFAKLVGASGLNFKISFVGVHQE